MQPAKPAVYVLVRVPKAGSTAFSNMIRDALPDAATFRVPQGPAIKEREPLVERLRATRSRWRALARRYGTLSMAKAWQHIDTHARDGDIVQGHLYYGDPVLPSLRLNYITLLRDPLARALSDYNYTIRWPSCRRTTSISGCSNGSTCSRPSSAARSVWSCSPARPM